ncbi:MAG: hypothetical protein J6X18_17735 [Bacteroidales bacterium]|nr:hypothetical protein [Bacteroidales bacterium]
MTKEEEVRKQFKDGFEEIKPMIEQMSNLMMDCYEKGFKTCWKILTGTEC